MRIIKSLADINYAKTELVRFEATVVSVIAEGDGEKKPYKFSVKLEESGEVVTVVSWKFENLDTIKTLAKTDDIYSFEASAGNYGVYGNQIRIGNISPTGKKSEKKVIREYDISEIRTQITARIKRYLKTDPLALICDKLILQNDDFFRWPAATKIHHNYSGGLAIHSLGVANNALSLWNNYRGENLNLQLIIAGALLHDIGKLDEYDVDGKRTIFGNLIPHPVSGADKVMMVAAENGFNPAKDTNVLMLRHIILSHHEKLEYGAAVQPYINEAWIVAMADQLDARIESIEAGLTNIGLYENTEKLLSLDGGKVMKWHY